VAKKGHSLRVIALGGLGEIGKNMLLLEYANDILVIDAGMAFPEDEMLGIDIVIPDFGYLMEHKDRVRAVVLTHGHEDHVGALPYLLRELDVPVYGSNLTLGLADGKLSEHGLSLGGDGRVLRPGDEFGAGCFRFEAFRVNHSIADALGLTIRTPVGRLVHTGDFKFDQTPVDGQTADFHRLGELGSEGVLLLLSDSTNSERPGYTPSEREVGRALDEIFRVTSGRILATSFATNVPRLQQVFNAARRYGRRVAVVGRSVENVVEVARRLGYLEVPDETLCDVREIGRLPDDRVAILTTGSQGEPMSALTRMAMSEHRQVDIRPGDTVIIAATAIPGNEKLVNRTVDHLFRQGARVVYEASSRVHVSGHASQEELKLMINLVRPKYFLPVHGEYRQLIRHAELAGSLGIPEENIFVGENGSVWEFTRDEAREAGTVQAGNVLVDGLGVGDVGNVVLRDRNQLAKDGILICILAVDKDEARLVAGPEILSRGFVYIRGSEELLEETRERAERAWNSCNGKLRADRGAVKARVREALSGFLEERTGRRPMILPILVEVGSEGERDRHDRDR